MPLHPQLHLQHHTPLVQWRTVLPARVVVVRQLSCGNEPARGSGLQAGWLLSGLSNAAR